jgi:peptide/nickel transport system permease protein
VFVLPVIAANDDERAEPIRLVVGDNALPPGEYRLHHAAPGVVLQVNGEAAPPSFFVRAAQPTLIALSTPAERGVLHLQVGHKLMDEVLDEHDGPGIFVLATEAQDQTDAIRLRAGENDLPAGEYRMLTPAWMLEFTVNGQPPSPTLVVKPDRPLFVRYVDSMLGIVTLNFGNSYVTDKAVLPQLLDAIGRSAKLAGLALLITIPLAVTAGIYAARKRDRPVDRGIVLLGVTSASIPEFVTGTILVIVVGVQLKLLPVLATPPPNADIPTQIRYLLMPATAMAIVYFGYIARMTRAGTIDVLQSDYTRTATMKGLTAGQTMRRHVLRNALIPTVAVIAVQIGYLFGGIIAVEKIFNYNGMGQTMLFAAQRKDLPMLTAGVLVIGIVYMIATLIADLTIAWMNPRIRLEADR